MATAPQTRTQWRAALAALPTLEETKGRIPSFFYAHGHPGLLWPAGLPSMMDWGIGGPGGPLSTFLQDFGKELLSKYRPKAVLVFSAHWETSSPQVTDYDDNPLLYDYYGFDRKLYDIKFNSKGDPRVARRVVEILQESGYSKARLSGITESRGRDGRPRPPRVQNGLDHGVFLPSVLMFGETSPVPIVQASIADTLEPEDEWRLGQAVSKLRDEGILVIAGGLTIHTFQDFDAFNPAKADAIYHEWHKAIINSIADSRTPEERKAALLALTKHRAFRKAHPREDHFVPLYVAAGAGQEGNARVLAGLFGAETIAFGLP
ncbi:hypothetical protein E5Q_05029 [Mixia osmundae IAM 14324]|nr:hypothetical protein E5Q_05029 [Mixia osmundae IAM 14324]